MPESVIYLIIFLVLWILGAVKARAERAAKRRGQAPGPVEPGVDSAPGPTGEPGSGETAAEQFRKLLREMAEVEEVRPVPAPPRRARRDAEDEEDIDEEEWAAEGSEESEPAEEAEGRADGGFEEVIPEEDAETERRRRETLARLEAQDEDAYREAPRPLDLPARIPTASPLLAMRSPGQQPHAGLEVGGSHAVHYVEGVPSIDLLSGTPRARAPHVRTGHAGIDALMARVSARPVAHQMVIMAEVMGQPRSVASPTEGW